MPPEYASLKRRPFLTPIWLTVLGAVLAASVLAGALWIWATADSTLVFVIRHAETDLPAGSDGPVSAAGAERAVHLAQLFAGAGTGSARGLDGIYVSPALCSRMTAAPLAKRLSLVPVVTSMGDAKELAHRVLREHGGGRILIVAHRDSVTGIVDALSGDDRLPILRPEDYGTLYVVALPRIGRANVIRMSY